MFLNIIFVVIVAIVAFAVPVLFNTLTSPEKTRPFFHKRQDDALGSTPQKDLQEIELTIKDVPTYKPDLVEKNTPPTFPTVTAQINPAPPTAFTTQLQAKQNSFDYRYYEQQTPQTQELTQTIRANIGSNKQAPSDLTPVAKAIESQSGGVQQNNEAFATVEAQNFARQDSQRQYQLEPTVGFGVPTIKPRLLTTDININEFKDAQPRQTGLGPFAKRLATDLANLAAQLKADLFDSAILQQISNQLLSDKSIDRASADVTANKLDSVSPVVVKAPVVNALEITNSVAAPFTAKDLPQGVARLNLDLKLASETLANFASPVFKNSALEQSTSQSKVDLVAIVPLSKGLKSDVAKQAPISFAKNNSKDLNLSVAKLPANIVESQHRSAPMIASIADLSSPVVTKIGQSLSPFDSVTSATLSKGLKTDVANQAPIGVAINNSKDLNLSIARLPSGSIESQNRSAPVMDSISDLNSQVVTSATQKKLAQPNEKISSVEHSVAVLQPQSINASSSNQELQMQVKPIGLASTDTLVDAPKPTALDTLNERVAAWEAKNQAQIKAGGFVDAKSTQLKTLTEPSVTSLSMSGSPTDIQAQLSPIQLLDTQLQVAKLDSASLVLEEKAAPQQNANAQLKLNGSDVMSAPLFGLQSRRNEPGLRPQASSLVAGYELKARIDQIKADALNARAKLKVKEEVKAETKTETEVAKSADPAFDHLKDLVSQLKNQPSVAKPTTAAQAPKASATQAPAAQSTAPAATASVQTSVANNTNNASQDEGTWTTMPLSGDLPPQIAQLGENLIGNVFKQLPSSKKMAKSMPFDEFRLRVKEALDSSPDVAIVSNMYGQSQTGRSLALANLLPQVTGTSDTGRRRVARDPYTGSAPSADGRRDGANFGITVSQLVFDFGAGMFGLRAGEARMKAAQELMNSKKSEQALKTVNAFIELERARDLYQLAKENAAARFELVKLVRERNALGGGTKPDVIRAESRYAEALSNIALMSSRVNSAEAAYLELFASKPTGIVLGPDHEFVIEGLNKSAEELAATYPGLLQLAQLKDASAQEAKNAMAKMFPSFNLVYSTNSVGNFASTPYPGPTTSSSVVLQLNYPLYTGGADTARKEDAKLKAQQAEQEFQSGMRQYEKFLTQGQSDVINYEEIVKTRTVSVRSAIASLRAVREQFAFNKGNLLDLMTAQESLYQAGRDLIDTNAERNLARYRLLHLTSELNKVFQLADAPISIKD